MPRLPKGPYLHPKRRKDGRASGWIIRDRINGVTKDSGTGLGFDASEQAKAEALAGYLAKRHTAPKKSGGDLNEALVADCLAEYLEEKLGRFTPPETDRRALSRQDEDRKMNTRLIKFFGLLKVREVTGELQKSFAKQRGSQAAARRELNVLSAAINAYQEQKGGAVLQFKAILPPESPPRERWLTRQEAARIIRAMWRFRQKNRGGGVGRLPRRHCAKYVLCGLYTGSRARAICGAETRPAIGRGWVDLERGVFHRVPAGARLTNKNKRAAVPINLPLRLLTHLRRWDRLGLSKHAVVEWNGKAIRNCYGAFKRACRDLGLGDVMPHTLRHTAVSWYLRGGVPPGVVADYVGMSETILKKVYKHHMPGAFAPIHAASLTFGRTDRAAKAPGW
jgi:integrase